MVMPWQRAAAPVSNDEEPWDASRGVGDWRARMQAIYDAENAAEDDEDEDEDEDDVGAAAPGASLPELS